MLCIIGLQSHLKGIPLYTCTVQFLLHSHFVLFTEGPKVNTLKISLFLNHVISDVGWNRFWSRCSVYQTPLHTASWSFSSKSQSWNSHRGPHSTSGLPYRHSKRQPQVRDCNPTETPSYTIRGSNILCQVPVPLWHRRSICTDTDIETRSNTKSSLGFVACSAPFWAHRFTAERTAYCYWKCVQPPSPAVIAVRFSWRGASPHHTDPTSFS